MTITPAAHRLPRCTASKYPLPLASVKKKKEEENDELKEEQETENGGRGTEAQSQGGEETAGEESTA
jgi:hypothetical protein